MCYYCAVARDDTEEHSDHHFAFFHHLRDPASSASSEQTKKKSTTGISSKVRMGSHPHNTRLACFVKSQARTSNFCKDIMSMSLEQLKKDTAKTSAALSPYERIGTHNHNLKQAQNSLASQGRIASSYCALHSPFLFAGAVISHCSCLLHLLEFITDTSKSQATEANCDRPR